MITVYGAGEVAKLKGVTDAAVSMWLSRYDDYPPPHVTLVSGRRTIYGWLPEQMQAWVDWKPGGPKFAASEPAKPVDTSHPAA